MIGAVVLAAGAATRFGAPKQRLLLPAVLEHVQGLDEVVVVAGAYPLEGAIDCPDWETRSRRFPPLRARRARA